MNTQNSDFSSLSGASAVSNAGADKYPNPFFDIASAFIPTNLNDIFTWCEYLMLSMAPFRAVAQRVVRYFLTEIIIDGPDDKEREKYKDFVEQKLHLIQQLAEIGDDFMTYGNSFVSIYFPFDRWLICPECKTEYHCETLDYKFSEKNGEMSGICPKCGKQIVYKREDRRSRDLNRVRIIRWNPKKISLRVHPISGETEYYLHLDEKFVEKVIHGDRFYLEQTPWGMVETCLRAPNSDNQYLFKFNNESIYHLKSGSLAGLPIKGWGIPSIMPNFKLAYYVQLMRRYDEAIALDFIVPFRVLFPQNMAPGGQDALTTISMQTFISAMNNMVEKKRANLTDIQVAPFSIGYQMIGGEAKQLAPKDSIELAMQELLNAMGFPQELYAGTLSLQAAPVALRLFEKQWNALVDGFNDIISWMLNRISKHFMWGNVTGTLRSVTLADDMERKGLLVQAAAGMDLSKQTAYSSFGVDYLEEQQKLIDEQTKIQELQQKAMMEQQAQMANQNMGGGSGPSADGSAPGGTPGATPGDVYEQAGQLAQQLLLQTPETQRRGELIKIKQSNPTLHALVLERMDEFRREWARQGQVQVMEQMKQASALSKSASANEIPSLLRVGLQINDQIMDYSQKDLQKIAMDIRNNVPHAKDAFHFIYSKITGSSK